MFLLRNEKELLRAFRPRDQRGFEPPPDGSYPRTVHDYLAWVDSAGVRVFLVFMDPAARRPLGIAFRRDLGGEGPAQLCEWCHSHGSSAEIGLLSTSKSSKRRLGVWLCRDLRCKEKLEQAADLSGRSAREPIRALLGRMARFAHEGLDIQRQALAPEPPEAE